MPLFLSLAPDVQVWDGEGEGVASGGGEGGVGGDRDRERAGKALLLHERNVYQIMLIHTLACLPP